jgi:hypothetical protein
MSCNHSTSVSMNLHHDNQMCARSYAADNQPLATGRLLTIARALCYRQPDGGLCEIGAHLSTPLIFPPRMAQSRLC